MKTNVIRVEDGKYQVVYRRFFWSSWFRVNKRFLSKKNAESYAERLKWKFAHPRKYRKMLDKYGRDYFTGHGGDATNA